MSSPRSIMYSTLYFSTIIIMKSLHLNHRLFLGLDPLCAGLWAVCITSGEAGIIGMP